MMSSRFMAPAYSRAVCATSPNHWPLCDKPSRAGNLPRRTATHRMNLNVGQGVSPALFPAVPFPGCIILEGAGETHCPTLRPARFRGSKRALLVRGILSRRAGVSQDRGGAVQIHPLPPTGCSIHQHQHGGLLGRLYHVLKLAVFGAWLLALDRKST